MYCVEGGSSHPFSGLCNFYGKPVIVIPVRWVGLVGSITGFLESILVPNNRMNPEFNCTYFYGELGPGCICIYMKKAL